MSTRRKKGKEAIAFKKIWRMMRPALRLSIRLLPVFVLAAILQAGLVVAEPYIYGRIVDDILHALTEGVGATTAFQTIRIFLLLWIGVVIASSLMSIFYSYVAWWLGNFAIGRWTADYYDRMMKLGLETIESRKSGELVRRFDNAWSSIFGLIAMFFRDVLLGCMTFLVAVIVGMTIDWRMALVALIPVPLVVLIGVINFKITYPKQHKVDSMWDAITGDVSDSFTNFATVKSYSLEDRRLRAMTLAYAKTFRIQNRANWNWSIGDTGYSFIYVAGRLVLFAAGAWFVIQGSLSLGTMIMFLGFTSFLFGSVQQVVTSFPVMQRHLAQINLSAKLWELEPNVTEKPDAVRLLRAEGHVSFRHVGFSYENRKNVVRNISFDVPAGTMVALVGQSGAGKSTLAKLMLRFMDPAQGSITIDGYDLRDLTLKSVRGNVGFVMQENLLFHDTILNNIKLAKPNATKAEIERAAKRAQAHDFIKKLPKGYHSTVGERGVKLSGGEKQRIALARVLLEDPPILVLDEATSALDSKTEHQLQEALKEVMKGRTTIVIAHRLSTVMAAGEILVMDKGRVVDRGTHEELIKRAGLYKEYWDIQAGGYMARSSVGDLSA